MQAFSVDSKMMKQNDDLARQVFVHLPFRKDSWLSYVQEARNWAVATVLYTVITESLLKIMISDSDPFQIRILGCFCLRQIEPGLWRRGKGGGMHGHLGDWEPYIFTVAERHVMCEVVGFGVGNHVLINTNQHKRLTDTQSHI